MVPIFFLANPLARPDPQSQPSLTLNLQALIFYHLQALILYPMFRFLAARLRNYYTITKTQTAIFSRLKRKGHLVYILIQKKLQVVISR